MIAYGEVLENVDLKKYSTIKIGGIAKYLVKPHNDIELFNLIKELNNRKAKYYVLGNGSNVLLDDNNFDGVIILLDSLNEIVFHENEVSVGAGVMLPILVNKTLENGFVSLAFASSIPGTIGGSVVGNAGCFGHELMELVKCVKVMDKNGNIKILNKDEISFGYRYTTLKDKYIVLNVTFLLEKGDVERVKEEIKERNLKRASTQPLDKPNVGSIFRNPDEGAAGKFIEDLGFKGHQIGGAKVSEKHANFIVNEDNATFDDVVSLICEIKEKVKEKYNISLVSEVNIIRWNEL